MPPYPLSLRVHLASTSVESTVDGVSGLPYLDMVQSTSMIRCRAVTRYHGVGSFRIIVLGLKIVPISKWSDSNSGQEKKFLRHVLENEIINKTGLNSN